MTRHLRVPAALLGLTAALLPMASGQAAPGASGTPGTSGTSDPSGGPVVVTDHVRVPADNVDLIRPLRNDSDPAGEPLDVCRTDPRTPHRPDVFPVAGTSFSYVTFGRRAARADGGTQPAPPQNADHLAIITDGVRPGTYAVPYHACDDHAVTTGTVMVTVTRSINLQVRKIAGRDGTLHLHNPDGEPMRVDLHVSDASGDFQHAGHRVLHLRAHQTRTVHVTGTSVIYDATLPHRSAGDGWIDGIRQPGQRTGPSRAAAAAGATRATAVARRDDSPDQAPVTQDDTLSVAASSHFGAEADVLGNDTDPDDAHRVLQICRISVPEDSGLSAYPEYPGAGGSSSVLEVSTADAEPGTYTITYDACDEHLLTAGTLTVTVTAAEDLQVTRVGAHAWRFRSPGDRTYHVKIDRDGHVVQRFLVGPGQTHVAHVRGRDLGWFASSGSNSDGGSLA